MKRKRLILSAALLVIGMVISYLAATGGLQVTVRTFTHIATDGAVLTGKLYIPAHASAAHPVPAVLTAAGGNNEYIRHENINTELASRGYAVITFNPFKHGDSSVLATEDMGAGAMLDFVWNLDFVDRGNIALEGHTMGGAYLTLAAKAQPDKVRSLIILDSLSINHALSGIDPSFPVNITWIVSRYNEHIPYPAFLFIYPDILDTIGEIDAVEEGRIYGSPEAGNTRALLLSASTVNTHGFSPDMIGQIAATLQRTMDSPDQRPVQAQRWPLLLLGKGLSFAGLIGLLFSLIAVLFAPISPPVSCVPKTAGRLRVLLLSAPLLMGALYIPIYTMGKRALNPSFIFPQTDSNGLAILAVAGACVYWLLGQVLLRRDPQAPSLHTLLALELRTIGKTFLKALAIASILYGCNLLYRFLFADHFSLGCMTLSLFTPRKAMVLLSYFPVFLLLFLSSGIYRTRSLHLLRSRRGQYGYAILLSGIGEALLLLVGFLPFLFTGKPGLYEGRFAIGMIMYILPLLPVFGAVDAYCYRRTGTVWLGAFLNTMLYSWAFIATNALELMW